MKSLKCFTEITIFKVVDLYFSRRMFILIFYIIGKILKSNQNSFEMPDSKCSIISNQINAFGMKLSLFNDLEICLFVCISIYKYTTYVNKHIGNL